MRGNANLELGGEIQIYNNVGGNLTRNLYHETNDSKYPIVEDVGPKFNVGVTKVTNNYNSATLHGLVFTKDWGIHYKSTSAGGKFFADLNAVYEVIDNTEGDQTEKALWTINNAKNWSEAVAASQADGQQKTVILRSNWTANATSVTTTSYTTSYQEQYSTGFNSGALQVPSNAKILLDMNGYTMNRGLSAARSYGCSFYTQGALEIVDRNTRSAKGKITGGFSSNTGSAIHFTGGTVKIHDIDITGNSGVYDAIYVTGNYKLTLGGSVQIYNNRETRSSTTPLRNIRLNNATTVIDIDSKLTGTQQFTVWRSGRGIFTNGFGRYNTADPTAVFKSEDSPSYEVVTSGAGETAEGMMWCYNNALNWSYACAESARNGGAQQTVTLYSNWTAETNSSYTTAFGTDSYYSYGGLYVPSNVNVVLDLKGFTLHRGLSSSTARSYGYVARIDGKLTIIDSSAGKTGIVRGAYNNYNSTTYGGGIAVTSSGTLSIRGGKIYSNRGIYGGISVYGKGKLELGGNAQVYDNYTISGTACNIYLHNTTAQSINVISQFTGSALSGGQKFGITRLGNGTFTNGFEKYNPDTTAETYFTSENSSYFVFTDDATGSKEAGLISYNANTNWEYAIRTSKANGGRPETVKLYSTWTATQNSSSGFGTVSGCYVNGALYVPAGVSIILDLNGYNVHRNCTTAISGGYVIYVDGGELIIRDTRAASGGYIRGGFNSTSYSTGGIHIQAGKVKLENGRIYGNKYQNNYGGGALYMNNNTTFEMTGGSIYGNQVTSTYSSAGVLYTYYHTNVNIRLTGGAIYSNVAPSTSFASGIHLRGNANLELGGEIQIYNNVGGNLTRNLYHETNDVRYKIVSDIGPKFNVGITKTTNNYLNTEGLVFTEGWGEHYKTETSARASSAGGKFFADLNTIYEVIDNGSGTLMEKALWTINNAKNWSEAVAVSQAQKGTQQIVTLRSDWTANATSVTTTSYTTSYQEQYSTGFSSGALRVPSNANILLNMNGYTMNRGLSAARSYGCSFYTQGVLEIINDVDPLTGKSGGKGTIRGGFSSNTGSAIYFTSGSVTLRDIDITGNAGVYGAVYVTGNYKLTLGGSVQIYNNRETRSSTTLLRNIRLNNASSVIDIDSELTGTQIFTVYRQGRGAFTNGYGAHNDVTQRPAASRFDSEYLSGTNRDYTVQNIGEGDRQEAEMFCKNNMINWSYACAESVKTGEQQTFVLVDNWTAGTNSSYTTAFGTDSYYSYGGLYVPVNANVILDLNGFTLNRGLSSSTKRNYGYVIRVDGKLTIIDSATDENGVSTNAGRIINGWNSYSSTAYGGGAISVLSKGELTVLGGRIYNNHGEYGGISVYSSGKLNLGGNAQIYSNTMASNTSVVRNIYLQNASAKIGVVSEFTGAALANGQTFGVTRTSFGTLTENYSASGNTADPTVYFKSEMTSAGWAIDTEGSLDDKTLEASIFSTDPNTNWEYAVKMSLANDGQPWECKLHANWRANRDSSEPYVSGFWKSTNRTWSYYYYGALYVPAGANVILDLNGFYVHRNMNVYKSYGYAIYLNGGLEIIDSSEAKTGYITGGRSTNAGGIYVTGASAELKLNGGAVRGNRGQYAIYVASNAEFGIGGSGRVYSNTNSAGVAANVYLANANTNIRILSKFDDSVFASPQIGVARTTNNAVSPNGTRFTEGWSKFYDESADPAKYFFCDLTKDYRVVPYEIVTETTGPDAPPVESARDGDGTSGSVKTVEAAVFCHNNQKNWDDACQQSMNTGEWQTFTLYSDWPAPAAQSGYNYGTAFGYTTYHFTSGGLYVYSSAKIKMNLNGYTLSRGLSRAYNHGFVIRVNGQLEIVDEIDEKTGKQGGEGKITGGYNAYNGYAGGIAVYGGTLTLNGGNITGNRGTYTGGVSVSSGATFNVGGAAKIANNIRAKRYDAVAQAYVSVSSSDPLAQSNLYFASASGIVNVISPLTSGEKIGIWRAGNGVFTQGFGEHLGVTANPASYFTSEHEDYGVVEQDNVGENGEVLREAAMLSSLNDVNWLYTVQQSLANGGAERTFNLLKNWDASPNSSYGKAFGTHSTAFYYGGLLVPAGANVVLNLNGNSINRLNTGRVVIYVAGKLTIVDNSVLDPTKGSAGEIKGGSQGIYVYKGGECVMQTGNVTGNAAYGVHVYDGSFEMTGGAVTKNNGAYNMYVTAKGTLCLGGNPVIKEPSNAGSRNLYLAPSSVIRIISKFDDSVVIPVTRTGIGLLTEGWEEHNTVSSADGGETLRNVQEVFVSEDPLFRVRQQEYISKQTDESGNEQTVSRQEGYIVSYDNLTNWHYAVTTSLATGTTQTVRLYPANYDPDIGSGDKDEWTATASANGFGTLSSFINGALYVPQGASVILDLHGITLNRNLASARANGYAVYVAGELVIWNDGNGGSVTGGKNSSASSAGAIYIAAGGTCTLGMEGAGNTVVIENNLETSSSMSAGAIYTAGTLNMIDAQITGNEAVTSGAVLVARGGTFNMSGNSSIESNSGKESSAGAIYTAGETTVSGGTIKLNRGTAGAVYVANNGKFTMTEGEPDESGNTTSATISGNTGSTAGGIFVYNSSSAQFVMEKGIILNNTSTGAGGGGVYVAGVATMTGGSITGNTASPTSSTDDGGSGGGVYISTTGTFTMTGGSVTGNRGTNGLRAFSSATLNLGGSARIENNLSTDGAPSDMFITQTQVADIVEPFVAAEDGKPHIGVTREGAGVFTKNYGMMNKDADGKPLAAGTFFFSNMTMANGFDDDYEIAMTSATDPSACEVTVGVPVETPKALDKPKSYDGEEHVVITGFIPDKMKYEYVDLDGKGVPSDFRMVRAVDENGDEIWNIDYDKNGSEVKHEVYNFVSVHAGLYNVEFTPIGRYCWKDGGKGVVGTTAKFMVAGILAQRVVELEWSKGGTSDPWYVRGDGELTDENSAITFVYSRGVTQSPVARVKNLVTKDGVTDECIVSLTGDSGKEEANDPKGIYGDAATPYYVATALTLSNTDYTLKDDCEPADCDHFKAAYTITQAHLTGVELEESKKTAVYKTELALSVVNNYGDGEVTYRLATGSYAAGSIGAASLSGDRGELLMPLRTGMQKLSITVAETRNYFEATFEDEIEIKRAKISLKFDPAQVMYGSELDLRTVLSGATDVYTGEDGNEVTEQGAVTFLRVDNRKGMVQAETADGALTGKVTGMLVGDVRIHMSVAQMRNYEAVDDAYASLDVVPRTLDFSNAWIVGENGYPEFTYNGKEQVPALDASKIGNILDKDKSILFFIVSGGKTDANAPDDADDENFFYEACVQDIVDARGEKITNYVVTGSEGAVVRFRINRADVTVEIPVTEDAVYKQEYKLSVTVKAQLAAEDGTLSDTVILEGYGDVTYAVTNGADADGKGKASVNADLLTPMHTGAVSVVATVAQSRNFNLGTSGSATVTIGKAKMDDLRLDLDGVSFVYGTAVELAGLVKDNGDGENEGDCADQTGYGAPAFSVTEDVGGTGGKATVGETTGTFVPTHVGKVKITVNAAATHNYEAGVYEIEVEIAKRPIELEWGVKQSDGSVVWDNDAVYSVVYDGKRHNPEVRAVNTVGGEIVTVTLEDGAIDVAFAGGAISNHTAKPVSLSNENYTLDHAVNPTKEYTITPLQATIGWSEKKKFEYNGQVQYPEAFVANLVDREDTGAKDTCGVTVLGTKDAGSGLVAIVTGLLNPNYTLGTLTDADLSTEYEIVPKTVTLVWSNTTTLVYNGSDQAPTATVGNLESGDTCDVTVVGKQINAGGFDEAPDGSLVLNDTYIATAFALSNPNYTLNRYDENLDQLFDESGAPVKTEDSQKSFLIQRAPIEIDLESKSTVYGTDGTLSITGNVGNGGVAFSVADSSAATGKATITDNVITPVQAGVVYVTVTVEKTQNYLGKTEDIAYTIERLPVVLSWQDPIPNFVYNGTMQAPSATVTNLVYGDAPFGVTVQGSIDAGADLTASAIDVENKNYTVVNGSNLDCKFVIAPRPIAVVWSESELVYNGQEQYPAATAGNVVTRVGANAPDVCTLVVSGAIPAGDSWIATVTGIADNANYTLEGARDLKKPFVIKPRPVILEWTQTVLPYNGKEQGPIATILNLVPGDTCNLVFTGTGINVGNYTATATGVDNDNYTLDGVTDRTIPFSIVKAEMPLELTAEGLIYGTPFAFTLAGNPENGAVTWSLVNASDGSFSGNTFTPKRAGTVTVRVSVAATSNYLATTKDIDVEVAQRIAQFVWTNTDFGYDGTEKVPTASVGNPVAGDTVIVTVSGGEINAGNYTATATALSNDNYRIVNEISEDGADVNHVRQSYTINRASINVDITTRKALLGRDLQLAVSGNTANGDVTWLFYSGSGEDEVTSTEVEEAIITGSILKPLAAGTVHVKVIVAETRNTYGAEATADIVIEKGTLPLAFGDIIATYGSNFTVNVTGNLEDSPVVYTILSGGTGAAQKVTLEDSEADNVFKATRAGKITIQAHVAATENYDAATITIEIEIAKLPIEVLWNYAESGYVYNGASQAPSATVLNLIEGDTVNVTVNGQVNAGNGLTASVSAVDNANYTVVGAVNASTTFDILPKTVNSVTWDSTTRFTFDGQEHAPSATVPSNELIAGDQCDVIVSGAQSNAGSYIATATGLANPNYRLDAAQTFTQSFEIEMAKIDDLLSISPLQTNFGVNVTLSVLNNLGGGDVTFRIEKLGGDEKGDARLDGDTLVPLHVGKVRIIAVIAETMNTYGATVEAEFTINPGVLSLTLADNSVVYGDVLDLELLGNLENGAVTFGVRNPAAETDGKAELTADGLSLIPRHVGNVEVLVSVAATENYAAVSEFAIQIAVTPRPAAFTWEYAESYVYDKTEKRPVASVSNLVEGDNSFAVEVSGAVDAGKHTAKVVSLENPNYMIADGEATNQSGEFTILPKAIGIAWEENDFTYNGTKQVRKAYTDESLGLINGDECRVLVGDETVDYGQVDAGTGYPVKALGTSNPNYVLSADATNLETTFDIKKANRTGMYFPRKTTAYDAPFELTVSGNAEDGEVTFAVADLSFAMVEANENGTVNVFTPVKVGKVNVTATVGETKNYLAGTLTDEFEITMSTLSVSLAVNSVIYGDTLTLSLIGNEGGGKATYSMVSGYGAYARIGTNPETNENDLFVTRHAGVVRVRVRIPATENYSAYDGEHVITIERREVAVNWGTLEHTYDGRPFIPTPTITPLINNDRVSVYVTSNGYPGGTQGATEAGGYTATIQSGGILNNGYNDYVITDRTTMTAEFNIGQAPISFEITSTRGNVGTPLKLEVSNNPGKGEITYQIMNGTGSAEFVEGKTDEILPTSTGTVIVTATIAATKNYLGNSARALVVIDKPMARITLDQKSVIYDSTIPLTIKIDGKETTITPTYYVMGVTGNANIADGKITGTKAGVISITITTGETPQYAASSVTVEFTVKPKPIEGIEWTIPEGFFTYNGKEQAPTAVVQGLRAGDVCEAIVKGYVDAGGFTRDEEGNYIGTNGAYRATVVGLSNDNYTLEGVSSDVELVSDAYMIKKKPITVELVTGLVTVGETLTLSIKDKPDGATVTYEIRPGGDGAAEWVSQADGILRGTELGTVYIYAEVSETKNYEQGSNTVELEIKKPPAPVRMVDTVATYGIDFILDVIGSGGGEVTYEMNSDADKVYGTIMDSILMPRKVGKFTIKIKVGESDEYRETEVTAEITIVPCPVVLEWTVPEEGFTYNGKEQAPTATPKYLYYGDNAFAVTVTGGVEAGSYVARATALANENYTLVGVENESNLTCAFEIKKKTVTFTWEDAEYVYNGKAQAPKILIADGVICSDEDGNSDELTVTVAGNIDAGDYTAVASAVSNNNYTLEGNAEEALSKQYTIKPAEVVLEWGETSLEYNGGMQMPQVGIKADSLFVREDSEDGLPDECLILTKEGEQRNVGVGYTAKVLTVSNKNYVLPAEATKEFEITPLTVVIDWAEKELVYNATQQHPAYTFNRLSADDVQDDVDLTFTFERETDGINVGKYTVKVSLSGNDAGNYKLASEDESLEFDIVAKEITVLVQTLDITADYTGEAITLGEWYRLVTEGLEGDDAKLALGDLFDLSGLALEPLFIDEQGNELTSVSEWGSYAIRPAKYPESLSGKTDPCNYSVKIAEDTDYGTLKIKGSEYLQVTEDSVYQFQFMKPIGASGDVLRTTYGEASYVHGKDDETFDRVVLGQISPNTSVKAFLENVVNPEKARIYRADGTIVYDCGTVAEAFEAMFDNGNALPVGTGWYVAYGVKLEYADVVYLSVLGDVDGDGVVSASDASAVNSVIIGGLKLDALEFRLAAMLSNSGRITAADTAAINAVIIGVAEISDYFTFVPKQTPEQPVEPEVSEETGKPEETPDQTVSGEEGKNE